MERGGFFFAEGTKLAGAAFDDGRGDVIRKCGGAGAGADGVGKNVQVGEGARVDEIHGVGVVFFGFAGEAGDYVGADGGVWEPFLDEVDAARVVLGTIPAMHGGEDMVGGGLQRHVEVFGQARRGCEERDHVARDIERFDRA